MARDRIDPNDATIAQVWGQKHRAADILAAPLVLTPSKGKRIIVQSWQFLTDRAATGPPIITFSSPGSDSVTWKFTVAGQVNAQGWPYFVTLDDVALTITLAGGSGGTFAELQVGYLEI
jgi:hypothetical protein